MSVSSGTQILIEADTIKSLAKAAGILALIIGVILLLLAVLLSVATLWFIVGIIPLAIGIIDIFIYTNTKEIESLVEAGDYARARAKTYTWMILGFIFGGIVVGILLMESYVKYDDLLRYTQAQQHTATAGPLPPV